MDWRTFLKGMSDCEFETLEREMRNLRKEKENKISENIAWQIKDLLQTRNFEYFSDELVGKFAKLLEEIV